MIVRIKRDQFIENLLHRFKTQLEEGLEDETVELDFLEQASSIIGSDMLHIIHRAKESQGGE